MGSFIEALLRGMSAGMATEVFCSLILAVFLTAVYQARQVKGASAFVRNASTLMTSLGILGTFVGIVIGLLAFDVEAIDTSISALLEGMKTAFITSLVGMALSVVFKLLDDWKFSAIRDSAAVPEDVTPAHILGALERQNESLLGLSNSLAGAEEGSVVGQMKLLRSDVTDAASRQSNARQKFEEQLFSEMQDFANLLSKSATEAVIDALRQVIVDFNNNLTEQFGDNFKALDTSVQKLVSWQEQYGVQIEQMGQQFQRSVDAIDVTREAIEKIGVDCGRIPEAMEELRDVLEVNQHQIQELQRHLEAFVSMRDRAIEAVPEIQRQVSNVAEQLGAAAIGMGEVLAEKSEVFAGHVNSTNRAVLEMANEVSNGTDKLREEFTDSVTELTSASREMVRSLERAATEVHQQVTSCTENMVTAVQRDTTKVLGGVEQQVATAVGKTGEAVNAQMSAIDKALAQELERVFSRFGTSLAKISDAYTRDYESLIKRLAEMSRAMS